jgi:hypothetical protein
MRRLILILLLTVMPLQWSWAAIASFCQHEAGRAEQHLGHHVHEHAGADEWPAQGAMADKAADPSSDEGSVKAKTSVDSDCHGHGFSALMGSALTSPALWTGGSGSSVYRCQIPDRSPDRLLRPPSSHLA